MKAAHCILIALVVLSFCIGIYAYQVLPERVPGHWNAAGEIDGFMSKFWGAFLMPLVATGTLALFFIIPLIDPKRKNIERFRAYFDGFIILIMLFLIYIYVLTLLAALGVAFSMILVIIPAFAVLFFYAGILIEHAEQNWSIGIRTPWTLSDKDVWKKTHQLGGLLFKLSAVISLFGLLVRSIAIWLVIGPVVLSVLITFVYSYVLYGKKKR